MAAWRVYIKGTLDLVLVHSPIYRSQKGARGELAERIVIHVRIIYIWKRERERVHMQVCMHESHSIMHIL